jgi:hypothetical protein
MNKKFPFSTPQLAKYLLDRYEAEEQAISNSED